MGSKKKIIGICIGAFFIIALILCFILWKNNIVKFGSTTEYQIKSLSIEGKSDEEIIESISEKIREYYLNNLAVNVETTIDVNNDIKNEQIITMLLYYKSKNVSSVTKSLADAYFQEVYGFTNDVYNDAYCTLEGDVLYYYDVQKQKYVENKKHSGHGSPYRYLLSSKLIDYNKTIDGFDAVYLFLTGDYASGYFVNDVSLSEYVDEESFKDNNDAIKYFNDNIDKFYEIPKKHKYTFSIKGNNAFLTQYKTIVTPQEIKQEDNIKRIITNKIMEYRLYDLIHYENNATYDNYVTNSGLYAIANYFSSKSDNNEISKNDFDNYYKEVYGVDALSYPDLYCELDYQILYYYDTESNSYKLNAEHPGHGSPYRTPVLSVITDYSYKNDEYTLTYAFLTGSYAFGYFINDEDVWNVVETNNLTSESAIKDYFAAHQELFQNRGIKYQYTFKIEADKIYLKAFKKISSLENSDENIKRDITNKVYEYRLYDLVYYQKNGNVNSTIMNAELSSAINYYRSMNLVNDNITKWQIDKYFKVVYNIENINYPDLVCELDNEVLYTYDKELKEYRYNEKHSGHGSPYLGLRGNIITDLEKNNNEYTVTYIFLTGNYADWYFVNGESIDNFIDSSSIKNNEDANEAFHREEAKIKNVKTKYKFTFKYENDDYYLTAFNKES